jgi:hypothetical protein
MQKNIEKGQLKDVSLLNNQRKYVNRRREMLWCKLKLQEISATVNIEIPHCYEP